MTAESFWKLLIEGREAVGEVPADRWNVERFYDAEPGIAGKSIAKRGGFLDSIDQFDPQFFGISPREAPYVDPQHRLLLETAWEAIEDAGLVLDFENGHRHRRFRRHFAQRLPGHPGHAVGSLRASARTRPPAARTASRRTAFPIA